MTMNKQVSEKMLTCCVLVSDYMHVSHPYYFFHMKCFYFQNNFKHSLIIIIYIICLHLLSPDRDIIKKIITNKQSTNIYQYGTQ